MDNEPYRDLTHQQCEAVIQATGQSEGNVVLRQFTLPDGRIADLFVIHKTGEFHIIEVKTRFMPTLVYAAMRKYWMWCDKLWVASPQIRVEPCCPESGVPLWRESADDVGLIYVGLEGMQVSRMANLHSMPTARRNALTVKIANRS